MKSSTGQHYPALDHLRAVATFMVFTWHFVHTDGVLVPYAYVPSLPIFSILEEGHVGVALFMALSGYLFAKLLHGKRVNYLLFLKARALRLLPLLLLVMVVVGAAGIWRGALGPLDYLATLAQGFVLPVWPNGGWSIAVEIHFYVVLPLLLFVAARTPLWALPLLSFSMFVRSMLYILDADVALISYGTIVGRLDQFVIGMVAFQCRSYARLRLVLPVFAGFVLTYHVFNLAGGLKGGAPSIIWIALPTVEGIGCAFLIAYYDRVCRFGDRGLSGFVAKIGSYSFSIYLLHFFFVYHAARFIHLHISAIDNLYVAVLWSALCFLMMVPLGYVSFRFVEQPFLRRRVNYIVESPSR